MVELQINDGTNILDNLWTNVINSGARKRRHDSTHTGLLLSAIATELNVAISILQSYANQFTITSMTDRVLIENMASQYANRRLASKSKAVLTFYRMEGYNDTATIPAGFAVRSSEAPNIIFKTTNTVYLWKGKESVSVMAYSIGSGSNNNVKANTLTIFANDDFSESIGVTNMEASFGGYDDESISHLRDRANGFRYERDNTASDIRRQLYECGVKTHQYSMEEFNDDAGTYLICIDSDSDAAFDDVVTKMQYRRQTGISATYVRATRLYLDMYITVQTAGEVDYNRNEKSTIYANINDAIQKFFAAYCTVGADLRINALKAALNTALSSFDIADIEIEIANSVITNKDKNILTIDSQTKAYPNKILTSLEYVGGT